MQSGNHGRQNARHQLNTVGMRLGNGAFHRFQCLRVDDEEPLHRQKSTFLCRTDDAGACGNQTVCICCLAQIADGGGIGGKPFHKIGMDKHAFSGSFGFFCECGDIRQRCVQNEHGADVGLTSLCKRFL